MIFMKIVITSFREILKNCHLRPSIKIVMMKDVCKKRES